MTVGVHTATVTPPGGSAVDLTCWVSETSIAHGRDDSNSQPDADSATLSLLITPDTGPLPDQVEVGSRLDVATTVAGTAYTRFTGDITDIALGWDDSDPPDSGVGQIVATGVLAGLGRRVVGDVPFPQELDGARVSRIMAAAGITLNPAFSDPGTVQVLARDIDSQPALDTAQATAQTGAGVVWATRAGEVRYADANHRKSTPVVLTLDACDVLVTPTWRRTIEGLVNQVSIAYSVAPEGGEQPTYVAQRDDSITRYGRFGYQFTSELATADDATALGNLLLTRNSFPVWVMGNLPVAVTELTAPEYELLLGLEMHDLVQIEQMPQIGSAPTIATLWVEGWAERLAFGEHELELVVSGYCRTAPAPTWNTVDPSWVWGGVTWAETRRNLCANPSFETGTAGWGAAGGATLTADTTRAWVGAQALKITHAAGGANTSLASYAYTGYEVGQSYTISVYLWIPTGSVDHNLRVTSVGGATAVTTRDAWTRTTFTFTATSTTHSFYIGTPGATTAGQTVWVDGVMVERAAAPAGAYFDGDTADVPNVTDYAWTGTAHASPSTYSIATGITPGIDPSLTWDTMTCLGPPTNYGRWDDQPAALRWDQVPAATTWDTFTGG